ncbi:MAG: hypothetical protein ACLP75_18080 [Mycobacterium sp.]|uniref:hypothetical protein n=1 Tax=Mycobacterium sp. TaxID=1785 RepID=UPI003F958AD1
MKQGTVIASRELLTQAASLACSVIDDETKPDAVRDDAAMQLFQLTELLCFWGKPGDGGAMRLVPTAFAWAEFYGDMVNELVSDLGGERVEREFPASVLIVRQVAAMVDNMLYSNDFRLEALDCLGVVIDSLRRVVASDDEEGEPWQ